MYRSLTRAARAAILLFLLLFTASLQAHSQDPNPGGSGTNYLSDANPYYKWDYGNNHSTSIPYYIYQCTWYVWGRCADAGWKINGVPGADKAYAAITNGAGKGLVPVVGAIQCTYYSKTKTSHVSYVYDVESSTRWSIAQYNVPIPKEGLPYYSKDVMSRSSAGSTDLTSGASGSPTLVGFIYPPGTPNLSPAPNPSGSITSPAANGGTVSSAISVIGTASDLGSPVTSVTLTLDGNQFASLSSPGSSWSVLFDPSGYSGGSHVIGLTVTDAAGYSASYSRTIVISFPAYKPFGLNSPYPAKTAGVPLSWTYSGPTSGLTFRVNVTGSQSWSSAPLTGTSCVTGPLGPGNYTWTVTATNGVSSTTSDPAPIYRYTPNDFDGDGKSDLVVWRPVNGNWYFMRSSDGGMYTFNVGLSGDMPFTADFDGDGKPDLALWRPSNGLWYIVPSSSGVMYTSILGQSGDIPLVADFDGDGKADPAVWRPSIGRWYYLGSITGTMRFVDWGQTDDVPVAMDMDGDHKADFMIWRPGAGRWYFMLNASGIMTTRDLGQAGDVPLLPDLDGDGLGDLTVWRPSLGRWYWFLTAGSPLSYFDWGASGDIPLNLDCDGDGKSDLVIWRPYNGTWYVRRSSDGSMYSTVWGSSGDIPVTAH